MALWKDQSGREAAASEPAVLKAPEKVATLAAVNDPAARPAAVPQSRTDGPKTESVISSGLTIEPGAKLTGGVQADTVVIGGELAGNINAAARVELLQTGVLIGDLKAGSLIVAAGSRMRGQAEFGWDEKSKH